KVLRAAHFLAWNQPVERMRKSLSSALAAFALIIAAVALIGAEQWLRHRTEFGGGLLAVISVGAFIALWVVGSLWLPHGDAPWTALIPGAVFVGISLWLVHLTSVLFLAHRIKSASSMYGSLGVAVAILAWLYIIGRVLVGSAMLNATLWERRAPPPRR